MQFPTVTGANLLRQQIILPGDFKGDLNIVIIAFRQWQQMVVNTWLPAAKGLEQRFPGLATYELPVIQPMNPIFQAFINEGMRAGIPNSTTRERTITLYVDKVAFRKALNIVDENTIHILLVDRQGRILWQDQGAYSFEKSQRLEQVIRQVQTAPAPSLAQAI